MKNKTRRISRILPAILAVMLCVTVFPVTAFAGGIDPARSLCRKLPPKQPAAWSLTQTITPRLKPHPQAKRRMIKARA